MIGGRTARPGLKHRAPGLIRQALYHQGKAKVLLTSGRPVRECRRRTDRAAKKGPPEPVALIFLQKRKGNQTMATGCKRKTIEVDEDGILGQLGRLSTDVANYFAEVEGLQMTDQHWGGRELPPRVLQAVPDRAHDQDPRERDREEAMAPRREYQVPLRALSGRTREAGLQNRRSS